MDSQNYFKETLLFVDIQRSKNEKTELYLDYISKCFSYLLKQNDNYIITTLKKNNSLISFFFSYLLKADRSYDLCFDNLIKRKFNVLDICVLEFYLKIIEIFLKKDRKETTIIKSSFLDIQILMDVIMMLYKLNKKKIKELLNITYNITKFNFLNISKYVTFLYKEIKSVKERIDNYKINKNNLNNLLFEINEFIFCVYCFSKFFKKYHFFDINENKLINNLIIVKLFLYNGNDEKNEKLTTSCNFKDDCHFLYIFIQIYFDMLNTLYYDDLKDGCKKNILFLRYRFIKVLKIFIKNNLLYGDKRNNILHLSIIIDLLKEKSNEINLHFLRNDIYLSNWHFLEKLVLKNLLDFEFYSYINNFLKIISKKDEHQFVKKKYEHEIKQIKEITYISNDDVILKFLKKNNLNVSNCIEEILHLNEEEINNLENIKSEKLSDNDSENEDGNESESESENGNESVNESENEGKGQNKNEKEQFYSIKEDNTSIVKDNKKNIIEILRDNKLKKNPYIKKNVKYKYTNDSLDKENKDKILNLLNYSSSSHELSDNSIDNFENDIIFPNSYRKNYTYDSEEENENENENENKKKIHKKNFATKFYSHKTKENFISNKDNKKEINNKNDNEKIKSYYLKKRLNKGKFHRNQYDKKMSKGML
ncbi:conserved Plasmodium protein, unknown function [Plasmodium relictum]|uniref:Uncharacterized protein n=1 Tax=Plasmodium relictum TaxID=85471 RepID=A0A1J1HEF7_PLARL|nr:conserved Plasmodium protein, unknown function [Plasmodium relictum]CRH03926.1 conserved Plasmodium protein, unknown function [Plasmodium relictum]